MQNPTAEALAVCIATRTPVLLWGAPGTGKTSLVQDVVDDIRKQRGLDEKGFVFETVIASLHEPSDFSGLPYVSGDRTRMIPPDWAVNAAEAQQGLIFLDEASTAAPAVQAALLRVVFERTVGQLYLGDGIVFVAAANPPESAAGGWELAAPLANRFVHLDWAPTTDLLVQGLVAGFPVPTIPTLPDKIEPSPTATGAVAGFLSSRPALANALPADPAAASRGWPSSRSWTALRLLLTACEIASVSDETRNELVNGTVGPGVGNEFVTYLDALDLIDPETLIANPEGFKLPKRGDQQYAVLSAVATAIVGNLTIERWNAGWEILAAAADQGIVDVAAVAARTLAANQPRGARAPKAVTVFLPLLAKAGLHITSDGA